MFCMPTKLFKVIKMMINYFLQKKKLKVIYRQKMGYISPIAPRKTLTNPE